MKKVVYSTSFLIIMVMLLSACSPANFTIDLPFLKVNPSSDAQTQPSAAIAQQVEQPVAPAPVVVPGEGVAALQGTLTQIYETVNPSVVSIRVSAPMTQSFDFPFTFPGQNDLQETPRRNGLGSGFVWDKSGNIVTNNHVVEDATKIEVLFSDGTLVDASLVGNDPDADLAVIKVDVAPEKLFPVTLANSEQVKVGQLAIAIGSPYGLEQTMTVGIISALGRSLPVENSASTSGLTYSIPDVIQTDAPINPGNSGGVLLNDQAQVVGVTAAIESNNGSNAGIGYVIPSNIVKRVVPALIVDGTYQHAYLGISGTGLVPDIAAEMKLPEDTRGALVLEVTSGSPADKAGLLGGDKTLDLNGTQVLVGGDVITAIDDQPVTGMDDLVSYLATQAEVGQQVSLHILRDGKEKTLEVKLGSRPTTPTPQTASERETSRGASLGITAAAVTPEIASAMDLPRNTSGVLVVSVLSGSAADEAGLQGGNKTADINGEQMRIGGDVITEVEGAQVATVQELRNALSNYEAGQTITLSILRDGKSMDLEVTLGALQ